jgi:hypothetical protein
VRVAGIAVDIPTRGRPVARFVVVDDASGSATIGGVADFTSDDTDLATQAHDIAQAVRSRLRGVGANRVVVRRADRPPRASNTEGPRIRLVIEGAIASAAKGTVTDTSISTGRELGTRFGSSKSALDAAAASLVTAASEDARFVEATAAALAGLSP